MHSITKLFKILRARASFELWNCICFKLLVSPTPCEGDIERVLSWSLKINENCQKNERKARKTPTSGLINSVLHYFNTSWKTVRMWLGFQLERSSVCACGLIGIHLSDPFGLATPQCFVSPAHFPNLLIIPPIKIIAVDKTKLGCRCGACWTPLSTWPLTLCFLCFSNPLACTSSL